MPADARPFAEELAALSDEELAALLARRGAPVEASWRDLFDAAVDLLTPASVTRALTMLPRPAAQALTWLVNSPHPQGVAADAWQVLRDHALISDSGLPWMSVAAAVADLPALPPVTAPDASDGVVAHSTVPAASEVDAAQAGERAFTTVVAVAELVTFVADDPIAMRASGGARVAERRRLVSAGVLADEAQFDDLLALAHAAGLVGEVGKGLHATAKGLDWVTMPSAQRWESLAEAFRGLLPAALRTPTGGWVSPDAWGAMLPWNPRWTEQSAALIRQAVLLGLWTASGETPWSTALRVGGAADSTSLHALLPHEVDRIFLQNDLTAIAPGPLLPALDARLRVMAGHEAASHASTYRFTVDSITHALRENETAASLLEFLQSISLTGVPQPLRYLIEQQARRHGLVRVRQAFDSPVTVVESDDTHILQQILVDTALRNMKFRSHDSQVVSPVDEQTVFWALSDARYPVVALDKDGIERPRSRRVVADPPPRESAPKPRDYLALIARMRQQTGPGSDEAWLERELNSASRARAIVEIDVSMPDGSVRTLLMEASGVAGGRFRGADRNSDVERTVPLRSIRAARIVE